MIKTIIIDDEEDARQALVNLIKMFDADLDVVGMAGSVKSGLEAIAEHQPQLVFLDIKMPDGTGFDLLKKITHVNFKVIFVTAYQEYAIQAFRFSALDYLLKPLNPDDFISVINSAEKVIHTIELQAKLEVFLENKNEKSKKIVLKSGDDVHIVPIHDIVRCESDGNHINVFLNNGIVCHLSKTMKEYENMLEEYGFVRVHHAHLVNINYVVRLNKTDGDTIILKNNSEIPVSFRKKDNLIKRLNKL